jgi:hypothetical protein
MTIGELKAMLSKYKDEEEVVFADSPFTELEIVSDYYGEAVDKPIVYFDLEEK